jgi:hypothetical protein
MLLELQLSAPAFGRLIREFAKQQNICDTTMNFLGHPGKMLDHVELLPETFLQNTVGGPVLVTVHVAGGTVPLSVQTFEVFQPMKVLTTTLGALEKGQPPVDEFPMHPSVGFRFSIQLPSTPKGAPQLCVQLLPPPLVPASGGLPAIPCVSIDLSAFERILGAGFEVSNAGIAMDSDANLVSFRFEIGPPTVNSLPSWQAFYNGQIPNRLGGHEWACFIDGALMVPVVVTPLADTLAKGGGDFALDSGPSGSWSGGAVVVKFSGRKIDACTCAWGKISIHVDVTVTASFSVPSGKTNLLVVDLTTDYDPSDLDIMCCLITEAVAGSVIGGAALAGAIGQWGGVLGAVAGVVHAIAGLGGGGSGDDSPSQTDKVSDTHYRIKKFVHLNLAGLGSLVLTEAAGLPDGLLLRGSANVVERFYRPLVSIDSGFEWRAESCNSDILRPEASVTLFPDTPPWPPVPLALCGVEVLDDPASQIARRAGVPHQYSVTTTEAGQSVYVKVVAPPVAPNYPCKLLIRSNLGARWFQFAPAEQLTEQETNRLGLQKINACTLLVDPFWRLAPRLALILSLPDPPPDLEVGTIWQTLAKGLASGEPMTLQDPGGAVVATATATAAGFAELAAMRLPGQSTQLQLMRSAGGMPDDHAAHEVRVQREIEPFAAGAGRLLVIRAVQIVREAIVSLGVGAHQLHAGRFSGAAAVFVWSSSGLAVYNLSSAPRPALVHRLRVDGFRGHVDWQGRSYAWGPAGLAALAPDWSDADRISIVAEPVLDVERAGDHLYVLTPDAICVLDRRLDVSHKVDAQGAFDIAAVPGLLVSATDQGVGLFQISHGRVESAGTFAMERPGSLWLPSATAGFPALFVRSRRGGGMMLDFSQPLEPRMAARFCDDPWFVQTVRSGRILVQARDDGTLSVFRFWRTYNDLDLISREAVRRPGL